MEISEAFNKHFTEMGPNLASKLIESTRRYNDYINPANSVFHLNSINIPGVLHLLENLPINKAAGLDKIPCHLVKLAAPIIPKSIWFICNQSIDTGIFPSDLKAARVTPIFKSNEKVDLNNYRPISVLSPIAKVFERLVYTQLKIRMWIAITG